MDTDSKNIDSTHAGRKRARDMRTASQMIAVYCAGNHKSRKRIYTSFAGERLCEECADLDAYSTMRTRECKRMEVKTTCDRCEIHCYTKEQLERIREVMRYAGPRMIFHHPVAAIRHLIGS